MDLDPRRDFSAMVLAAMFVGALLGAVANREASGVLSRINFTILGLAISYFATPPFCKHFHQTDLDNISFFAFVIGMFGAAIVQRLLKSISDTDILKLILNKIGLGGS